MLILRKWPKHHCTFVFFAFATLMIVLELLDPMFATVNVLRFDRNLIAQGQWWRLLSGHLVHSNGMHLLMNMAGLLLIYWLFAKSLSALHWLIAIVISAGGIGALLFYTDDIVFYVGFSAVIHALLVYAALGGLLIDKERWPVFVLLVIGLKIMQEQVLGASEVTSQLIASDVALFSHLLGAMLGLILGLLRGLVCHWHHDRA